MALDPFSWLMVVFLLCIWIFIGVMLLSRYGPRKTQRLTNRSRPRGPVNTTLVFSEVRRTVSVEAVNEEVSSRNVDRVSSSNILRNVPQVIVTQNSPSCEDTEDLKSHQTSGSFGSSWSGHSSLPSSVDSSCVGSQLIPSADALTNDNGSAIVSQPHTLSITEGCTHFSKPGTLVSTEGSAHMLSKPGTLVSTEGSAHVLSKPGTVVNTEGSMHLSKPGTLVSTEGSAPVLSKPGTLVSTEGSTHVLSKPGTLVSTEGSAHVLSKPGTLVSTEGSAHMLSKPGTVVNTEGSTHLLSKPGTLVSTEGTTQGDGDLQASSYLQVGRFLSDVEDSSTMSSFHSLRSTESLQRRPVHDEGTPSLPAIIPENASEAKKGKPRWHSL